MKFSRPTKRKINETVVSKLQTNGLSEERVGYKLSTTRGFTLIEIMVSISIFAMVMMVSIGAVLAIVSANKKAQALNSVITNLNFALEGMVRDLRTGSSYGCGDSDGGDCSFNGASSVSFNSAQYGKSTVYSFVGGKIYKKVGDDNAVSLTSNDVDIKNLTFYISGTLPVGSSEYTQPKILIVIQGSFNGFGGQTDFNLETMVSQRRLDI